MGTFTFSYVDPTFAHTYNLTEEGRIDQFVTPTLEKGHAALSLLRLSRNSTYHGWNTSITGET